VSRSLTRSAIWSASVSRSSAGMVVPCGLFYIERLKSVLHLARM
jgi:hypothetical protein